MQTDEEIQDGLNYDGLGRAEEILDSLTPTDESIQLGLRLKQMNGAKLDALLTEAFDSTFSMKAEPYIDVLQVEGFTQVLVQDIPAYGKPGNMTEPAKFYVFFKEEEGILLVFDTYFGWVNSSHAYFNWQPNGEYRPIDYFISGCNGDDGLKAGSLDAREAIRFKIRKMRENGTFLSVWKEWPTSVWMIHHGDNYDANGDRLIPNDASRERTQNLIAVRMMQLPTEVRDAIQWPYLKLEQDARIEERKKQCQMRQRNWI